MALLLAIQWPLQAEPFSQIKLGIGYNDNLAYGDEVAGDTVASLRYSRAYPRAGGNGARLSYLFGGAAELYADYTDLNSVMAEAGFLYQEPLGFGTVPPWYQLGGTLGYQWVADGLRDALQLDLNAEISRRFGQRSGGWLGLGYHWQDARGATFDGEQISLGLGGDYRLRERWQLFAAFIRYRGEVVVTSTTDLQLSKGADRTTLDGAFGKGRIAYRLDGDTDVFELGLSHELGPRAILKLLYSRRESSLTGGSDSSGNLYALSYLYRY